MHSLFYRLFLSFVFIALLTSFTTVMVSYWAQIGPYAELMKRVQQRQSQTLANLLSVSGLAAIKILKNGGEEELLSYLLEVEKTDHCRILLLRKDNSTFPDRKFPPGVTDLVATARESHTIQHNISEEKIMVALPLSGAKKESMIIVGITDRIFWAPPFTNKQSEKKWPSPVPLGLPLLVMLFIAATGCLLLARSLTKPIRDLRKVAQKITRGDLSARVELLSRQGDEIADLSHDFNTMVERTESLLQSQKRLLRDISHELRSPLTRLNLALELARQQPDKTESYLKRIEKESERMNELINQLIILTRLEGEASSVPKEPVHLQQLLGGIVDDANFEIAGRKRWIKTGILDDVTVFGTKELLGRALENVLRNGLHYTRTETAVELSLTKDKNHATILVRDHGPGVPEEFLDQIFKPFFRVAESRDRNSGGAGIGLAIAKQAILMHGGTIQAQNAEIGGLVVQVRLPLL